MRVTLSLHPCQHFLFPVFFILAILTGVKWWYLVVLMCIFLVFSDTEHLFMCQSAICMYSLEKYLFRASLQFSIGFYFIFLVLSCIGFLYILDINPLSDISFANIFSHSVGCLFVLLIVSFAMQKLWGHPELWGWFSQLRIWLLILAQVMIPGWWDQAHVSGSTLNMESA